MTSLPCVHWRCARFARGNSLLPVGSARARSAMARAMEHGARLVLRRRSGRACPLPRSLRADGATPSLGQIAVWPAYHLAGRHVSVVHRRVWRRMRVGCWWRSRGASPRTVLLTRNAARSLPGSQRRRLRPSCPALSVIAVRSALRPVEVRRVRVRLARLPRAHHGLTIVQITDLHVGPTIGREIVEDIVDRTNALAPDIVAITGDLVDGSVERAARCGRAAGQIARAPRRLLRYRQSRVFFGR